MTEKETKTTKDVFSKVAASLMVVSILYIASISSDIDDLSTEIQLIQQRAAITTLEFRKRFDKISGHREKVESISDRLSKVEWKVESHLEIHQDDKEENKR